MADLVLRVEGLTKRFGGLCAVDNVSFAVEAGEVTGILGPNGAGKTTLFNLLTGFIRPDGGEVLLDGMPVTRLPAHAIVNRGCARTFQLCRPLKGMTVLENVLVACQSPRAANVPDKVAHAMAMLEEVDLAAMARSPVEILPYGDQRRLELARALATRPRLLLLDEPFAGLGTAEIQVIADTIRRLNREQGLTILLIEHKLAEFMQLVGRVVAMDYGAIIAIDTPEAVVRNPLVIEAYVGTQEAGHDAA
jgi:branched-chain amino acid transport system ATP-binding protein